MNKKKWLYTVAALIALFLLYRLVSYEVRRTAELNARTRYTVQKIDNKTQENKATSDLRYTYKQLKSLKMLEEETGSKEKATEIYLLRNK